MATLLLPCSLWPIPCFFIVNLPTDSHHLFQWPLYVVSTTVSPTCLRGQRRPLWRSRGGGARSGRSGGGEAQGGCNRSSHRHQLCWGSGCGHRHPGVGRANTPGSALVDGPCQGVLCRGHLTCTVLQGRHACGGGRLQYERGGGGGGLCLVEGRDGGEGRHQRKLDKQLLPLDHHAAPGGGLHQKGSLGALSGHTSRGKGGECCAGAGGDQLEDWGVGRDH